METGAGDIVAMYDACVGEVDVIVVEDAQGRVGNIVEENNRVGKIMAGKRCCGQTVYEVAGMEEVARGMVEQKADIS